MAAEDTAQTTGGQQITVEQLAAQLSRKTPPGETGQPAAPAPEGPLAGEAPAGEEPGTALSQEVAGETEPLREQQTAAEVSAEPGPGDTEPDWLKKRFARFTAKQHELEGRLTDATTRAQEAERKLAEAEKKGTPAAGKAWNHREQYLQNELAQKRALLKWADENPDGASLSDDQGQEITYTPEQVRAVKLSAMEDLGDLRGQLRTHQAGLEKARDYWQGQALKAYPQLADPAHEDSKNIEMMFEKIPWLREVPDALLSLADMLAGRALRSRRQPSPAAPATRVPAAAPSAPARTPDSGIPQTVKQAHETFLQTGRTEDLARRFAAQRAQPPA